MNILLIDTTPKHFRAGRQSLLMLYDADDSPEVVYDRIKTVLAHPYRIGMKMMRFKDLDTGMLLRKWGGIGDLFATACSWVFHGNIREGQPWDFLLAGDLKEFIEKVSYMTEFQAKHSNNDTHKYIKFTEDKIKSG